MSWPVPQTLGSDIMRLSLAALATALIIAVSGPALSQTYPAVPLLSGSKTVVGEDIAYPTTGKAVITAAIVTLAPGERTIMHQHGVPLFAYVLEGELTVDYGSFGKKVYRQGDALLEAMKVDHVGINTGTVPMKTLAVYMGAEGARDVIPAEPAR
jgi:quercetin dioxygenase-like cupin family protein